MFYIYIYTCIYPYECINIDPYIYIYTYFSIMNSPRHETLGERNSRIYSWQSGRPGWGVKVGKMWLHELDLFCKQ